ncbi:MAG: DUF4114 domain-containing protein [Burkholderiaceae bacterium]
MKAAMKLALGAGAALLAGAAAATPVATSGSFDGPGKTLQDYLQGPWAAPGTTIPANFVNTNQYSPDEIWTIGSTGTSAVTFVFELTANSGNNTFGIYNLADPTQRLTIYNGAAASPGQRAVLAESFVTPGMFSTYLTDINGLPAGAATSVTWGSSNFGLFMDAGGTTYFSQAALNAHGADQLVAYQGSGQSMTWPFLGGGSKPWLANEILLAWEDINTWQGGGDRDYNDMVILMESIKSVPVPAPLALLALGAFGMGLGLRRRA